jgi:hypothetical protein
LSAVPFENQPLRRSIQQERSANDPEREREEKNTGPEEASEGRHSKRLKVEG